MFNTSIALLIEQYNSKHGQMNTSEALVIQNKNKDESSKLQHIKYNSRWTGVPIFRRKKGTTKTNELFQREIKLLNTRTGIKMLNLGMTIPVNQVNAFSDWVIQL